MTKFKIVAVSALVSSFFACHRTTNIGGNTSNDGYRVGFYNTENLFDTENDPKINDEEFLPTGVNQWTPVRYQTKLANLSKVLEVINPTVMGFCEVENKQVVDDLSSHTALLRKRGYGIVHYNSPDERGIDVALIYKKSDYKVLSSKTLRVVLPPNPETGKIYPTRDILYVEGILGKKDTVSFFVNHWPSRRSGQKESDAARMTAAKVARKTIDSLLASRPTAKLILMGDLNDEPFNESITQGLRAKASDEPLTKGDLVDLMAILQREGKGTHSYKGEWNMLDHLVVSPNFLGKKGLHTDAAQIFKPDWILFTSPKGEVSPNRTYVGNKWVGGFSDHLPVFVDIKK
jgi:endonuclease/exonuclease/phosphatase family metal-dependent hydrolase